MQDTSGAACVEHVRVLRPPFMSRAEVISMSEFYFISAHLKCIVTPASMIVFLHLI